MMLLQAVWLVAFWRHLLGMVSFGCLGCNHSLSRVEASLT